MFLTDFLKNRSLVSIPFVKSTLHFSDFANYLAVCLTFFFIHTLFPFIISPVTFFSYFPLLNTVLLHFGMHFFILLQSAFFKFIYSSFCWEINPSTNTFSYKTLFLFLQTSYYVLCSSLSFTFFSYLCFSSKSLSCRYQYGKM